MSSEEVVALAVSDSGLIWGCIPPHESSMGVSVLPKLQGVSGGRSESLEQLWGLVLCVAAAAVIAPL